jgi:DNA-binding SARP family transcriptional activator
VAQVSVEVLGPVRALVDGVETRLGGRRERAVLALLAAAGGRPVTPERLVDEIWGQDAPRSASGSLQVAVSRLRSTLRPAGINLGPGGYALADAGVDADTLSRAARSLDGLAAGEVLARTEEALALWRGAPYADLRDVPDLAAHAGRLEEDRLRLEEARAAALLELGRPDEARAASAALVADHPFAERLWSLLALALYRCGRQADALETLRTLREALVEELGVDPSPAVRTLEADLLAQAPHLTPPATAAPVVGAPAADATRSRGTGVVGRAAVLAALEGALDGLLDGGRGGVVALTGEAGIGKSMLADEVARRARTRSARVLVGRCHEAAVAPAYWPWLPVLRELAGADAPVEVAVLLGRQPAPDVAPTSADAAALRTHDAVTRVLADQAEPLVVVLEDLHWADGSSLRLLGYAAEALRDRPVLFVVTVRDVEPEANPSLTVALAALARLGATRLRMPHLGEEAVVELLRDVFEDPDPELARVLARRTDGNPFFVLEMARLLEVDGLASDLAGRAERLEVPDGIADVIRLRLAGLPASAREALEVASVAGRRFALDTLQAVLERGPLEDLDAAVGAGIVRPDEEPGTFRFVHALTRETLEGDLRPGRRAQLHGRVGRALERRLGVQPELVTEVAFHLGRAAAYLPEEVPDAVRHGAEAARAAERRGAYEEAAESWRATLDAEGRSGEPDVRRRHGLLLGLAVALQRLGDIRGAQDALDAAVELGRSAGDVELTATAATGFRSYGVWHWREVGAADRTTIEVIEDCLGEVTDPVLRARLLIHLSVEFSIAWRTEDADRTGLEALELARGSGERAILQECLELRCVTLFLPGRARELERTARELLALEIDPERELAARFHLGNGLHRQGRAIESDEVMARAFELAAELRHTGIDIPLAWWRWLRAAETRAADADELAQRALALHRRTTLVGLEELTGLTTLEREPSTGEVPRDLVVAAADHPNRSYRTYVAHALARSREPEAALRLLGDPTPEHEYDYASHFANCLRVEVLALCGRTEGLAEALARIEPYADEHATYGSVLSAGSTAYFIGLGALALGDTDRAREALERAVRVNAASGSRRFEAHARAALAGLR